MLTAYRRAGRNLSKRMKTTKGGASQKALLNSYAQTLYEDCSGIIKKYAMEAAEVPQELLSLAQMAKDGGLDTGPFKDIRQILGPTGQQMLERFERGDIYKDGKGLSPRIWEAAQESSNAVHNVMAACLAQNMGAMDMAKVLEKYVDPTAKKTWDRNKIKEKLGPGYASWNKNVEYNSLRIARTTLSHSFTMGVKEAAKENPFLETVTWNSAHATPRTCQECEDRDGMVYKIKDVPFDHPNGLCWLTYNIPDLSDITRQLRDWINGEPNEKLDNWWNNYYLPMQQKGHNTKMSPEEWKEFVKQNLQELREKLGIGKLGDYRDLLKTLEDIDDQDYVKVFFDNLKKLNSTIHDGRQSAHYNPLRNTMNLPWKQIHQRAEQYGLENKWITLFHETGHKIDATLNTISKSDSFQTAMMKDIDKIVKKLKSDPNSLSHLMQDHNSQGVQDIISAIRNMPEGKEIKHLETMWRHRDEYWKRENVYKEAASELWADISQTYAKGAKQKSYMKEWFPNSYKEFEKAIKKAAKALK